MTDSKHAPLSAEGLIASDSTLTKNEEFLALHRRYSAPASDESFAKAAEALRSKTHKVTVAESKEEALKILAGLIPTTSGSTFSNGSSTTLIELGFMDHVKKLSEEKKLPEGVRNLKGEAVAAMASGDYANYGKLINQGLNATVFFTSVGAVTETGDIVFGDLTGSRVAAHTAQNLIFVVSANKIVPTYADAEARLFNYQRLLEGARARVAYSNPGLVGTVAFFGAIRAANAFGTPGRVHVVLVKGSYGY